jgi:hypothetical protein
MLISGRPEISGGGGPIDLRRRIRSLRRDHHQLGADRHHVAGLALAFDDRAGDRRADLDGCLLRHHVDQRLVLLDALADRHVPGDDLRLGDAFANVGQPENMPAHRANLPQFSIACRIPAATRFGPGK